MLTQKGFFDPHSSINVKRTAILRESIEGAGYKPGLFTMTVPTGGGKTISAFAFAMEHAKRYHKKRIIYVIPYTSIIEQTVEVLQSLLGKENVLAHHSQVDYDDVSETMVQQRLATENWDAPVIVTTNVQFLESLFSNKSSRCRKLHNIADSVILMDEAQMLPIPYLSPILACIKSLVKWFSCSVLLCSATQPHLERYISGVPFRELISNIPELYDFFERTTFTDEGRLEYDEVAAAVEQREQVLCICLTKKEAWGNLQSCARTLYLPFYRVMSEAPVASDWKSKETAPRKEAMQSYFYQHYFSWGRHRFPRSVSRTNRIGLIDSRSRPMQQGGKKHLRGESGTYFSDGSIRNKSFPEEGTAMYRFDDSLPP
jgi:hypothetical protein